MSVTQPILFSRRPAPHISFRTIVALAFTLVTLAAAVACGGGSAPPGGAPAGAPAGGAGGGVPVDMVTLAPKPVEDKSEFVGIIKSRRSTTIQPQVEGILSAIPVKSGDRVNRGDLLFEIDSTAERTSLLSLQSVRGARQADAAFAAQQAQRAKTLLDVGAMSQQEYELAVTQQKTAEAQLKAAEDLIHQRETELSYFKVTAPTAGTVADVPVRVGDRVTKTTPLTTVDDNAGLEVYINVPVQQAPRLKVGLPVRILNESGQTIVSERVNFVSPSVDDQTQTVLIKTALEPRGSQFRSDQFVRADVVFDTAPGLTVPLTAATRINGQYFVFVAEPARGGLVAKQRAVSLGAMTGNEYVVRDGLKTGEKLIVGGIQKIGDGAPVMALPPQAAPAAGAPAAGRGGQ